jgi:exopolyphosphatase/guanosine-5'-triphosphate,3'-diphosphate pyrophosphatase
MVIYRVTDGGSFEAYDQYGEMAKLGEGLNTTGRLGEEPMHRTIETLRLFKEIVNTEGLDRVLPIATSPIREAKNGMEFVRRARKETGFAFRVLSGKEEALFSFLGAAEAMDLSSSVFFDLGGGSLEITATRKAKLVKVMSLPIGALKLTQSYANSRGRYSKRNLEEMEREVLKLLPTRRELGIDGGAALAGVGGTVRALARYDQELRKYPFYKVHNYVLKRAAVELMLERLQKLTPDEIAEIEPIGGGRAESIVAGALVSRSLMERLSIDELHASTHGLRDGVLSAFLDDPYVYLKGSMSEAYVARSAKLPAGTNLLRYSRPLLNAFEGAGLISEDHVPALVHAVRLATGEGSCLDPFTLFYASMYEDSPLSHSCQLSASIALVRTRKPRVADWFLARYRSLLDAECREAIKGLASCATIIELLEKTPADVTARLGENGIMLEVTPFERSFPRRLLEEAVKSLEDGFGLTVAFKVKKEAPEPPKGQTIRGPSYSKER